MDPNGSTADGIECLRRAGWTSERNLDTTAFRAALVEDGYAVPDEVDAFLRQFGGLEITHPAYRMPLTTSRSRIDPVGAMESVYRERVEIYEGRVGELLTVVGEAYDGHMTLMLSPSGRMYGAYDDFLCLLGENGLDGLAALCTQRPVHPIG